MIDGLMMLRGLHGVLLHKMLVLVKHRIVLLLHLVVELVLVVLDELVHVVRDSRVQSVLFLLQAILVGKDVMPLRLLP